MPQFDPGTFVSQIFWLIVTFGVLYFFVLPFFLGKLGTVRAERSDRIEGDLERAEKMKAEAESLMAEYDAKLAEARATAQGEAKKISDEMSAKANAAHMAMNEELSGALNDAEARISAKQQAMSGELETAAADIAKNVVKKLSGVDVSSDAVASAVKAAH